MTTSTRGPRSVLRPATAATGQRTGCANCPPAEEPDLRVAVDNLSRKYTELAEVVARYMSEAGIDRPTRNAHAVSFAEQLARIVGGVETPPDKYPDCALIGRRFPNGTVSWFCSGVLVHPRVVLTAGHCQEPQAPINIVALNALDVQALQTTLVGFGNSDVLSTKGFGRQREVTVDITEVRRSPDDDLDEAEQTLGFESDLEFVAGGGGFDSCNGDSGGPAYIDVGE